MNSSDKLRVSVMLLVVFHVIGLIGLNSSQYGTFFEHISSYNLLLSAGLILWNHSAGGSVFRVGLFTLLVFILGMSIEIAGVQTGMIFGAYHYTSAMGASVLGVPLIIGLNWAMLTYATGIAASGPPLPAWARIFLGALLMVFCDFMLEGFAVKHHLWIWENSTRPPVKNFIAWFVVSLCSNGVFQTLIPLSRNRIAEFYLIVFLIFLILDRVL